jgi:hypothetical protein
MNKTVYTKLFLKELDQPVNDATVKEYMPLWWQNTREKDAGGLRLTQAGLEVVKQIGLATYQIPYPHDMPVTAQVVIYLDKFIDCPYYLEKNSITVTNERKAVELALFSGDVRKYGFAKAASRERRSKEN